MNTSKQRQPRIRLGSDGQRFWYYQSRWVILFTPEVEKPSEAQVADAINRRRDADAEIASIRLAIDDGKTAMSAGRKEIWNLKRSSRPLSEIFQ